MTFSTTYNFRDVGGYAGLDGRTVRWRRLFRADSLHRLKGADREAFAALGVRTVIDLRRPFEVEEHGRVPTPTAWTIATWCSSTSTGRRSSTRPDVVHERWLADRYLNFAEDGRAGLAAALGVIADPEAAPVVVHCMAGKDRTGVVCALTLSLLGCPTTDIATDYALTEAAMASLTAYLREHNPDGGARATTTCSTRRPEAMLLFLADLRAEHGSVEKLRPRDRADRRAGRRDARPPAD